MVMNEEFLSEFQERQMSFQPDFILEYAHHVGEYYKKNGMNEIEIYADSYVTLNGRLSQRFIDPNVNLLDEKRGFKNKTWILALDDEITGFKIFLFSVLGFSQSKFKGKVIDALTKTPIADVSIYNANENKLSKSNQDGLFELDIKSNNTRFCSIWKDII